MKEILNYWPLAVVGLLGYLAAMGIKHHYEMEAIECSNACHNIHMNFIRDDKNGCVCGADGQMVRFYSNYKYTETTYPNPNMSLRNVTLSCQYSVVDKQMSCVQD